MKAGTARGLGALMLVLVGLAAQAEEPPLPTLRKVLITVDDLPVAGDHPDVGERKRITQDLLAVLKRHRVPAVAFVIASRAESPDDEAILDAWLDAGHELGSHSWSHPNYTRLDQGPYTADIERARARLSSFLSARGRTLRFFRFPFLREGDTRDKLEAMREALTRSGQKSVPVTIDNQDWSFEAPWVAARKKGDGAAQQEIGADYQASLRLAVRHHEATSDRLFSRAVPQVLLLHANEVGAAQWDALFTWLTRTGHRFATADEVLADPALVEQHHFVGRYGFSLWDRIAHERREGDAQAGVKETLREQAAAWTRGDLPAFVSHYDEDVVFVSDTGVTRGRASVLERYRKRYVDTAAMGALSLDVLDVRPSSGIAVAPSGDAIPAAIQSVSVVARWTLKRTGREDASGYTMLSFEPRGERWVVVRDASF